MKTYRVAIIGTGGIANAHLNAVNELKDRLELVAVCDIDAARAEAFRAKYALPAASAYSDYATMLREARPDIVLVCTPPGFHAPASIAAMEAGAWVMCEKPLCASLAELDKVQETEARTGCYTACMFQMRSGSAGNHARKLIHDGTLGRPLVALANTLWFRDRAYYAVPWRGKWETEVGGTTMAHGIHTVDFLLHLLGDWEEVRAVAATQFHDIEVDDLLMAHVRFANGARASIMNSAVSPRQETKIRIDCEHATIEADYLYSYARENWRMSPSELVESDPAHTAKLQTAWDSLGEDIGSLHASQLATLIKNRDEGTRPNTCGEEARRTIDLLSALYKSAFTGLPVTRGSIQPGDPFYAALNGGQGAVRDI